MTYEYVCGACHHEWEAEQPISAKPLTKCPRCGKDRAKRQVSGGLGFLLKGGGWYADGYGSNTGGKKDDGGTDKASPSEKPSDKPEASDKGTSPSEKPAGKDDSSKKGSGGKRRSERRSAA
jgi:putative FmdB family regulatory protein